MMPLVVHSKGLVKYLRPHKDEMPIIGRLVNENETLRRTQLTGNLSRTSDNMLQLQRALLAKGIKS
jgi:hypothetical protein